jgi:uncharacterized protein
MMYDEGLGVTQDYAAAKDWYEQAAEADDLSARSGTFLAEYALGVMYEQGHGVAADRATAIAWYQKAAAGGNADAKAALARLQP